MPLKVKSHEADSSGRREGAGRKGTPSAHQYLKGIRKTDCVCTVLLQGPECAIIRSNNFNSGKIFSIIRTDLKY